MATELNKKKKQHVIFLCLTSQKIGSVLSVSSEGRTLVRNRLCRNENGHSSSCWKMDHSKDLLNDLDALGHHSQ